MNLLDYIDQFSITSPNGGSPVICGTNTVAITGILTILDYYSYHYNTHILNKYIKEAIIFLTGATYDNGFRRDQLLHSQHRNRIWSSNKTMGHNGRYVYFSCIHFNSNYICIIINIK